MKLPLAWLHDYVPFTLSSDEIAERFAMLGFPSAGIERRPKLSGIVVGRIARATKHPNADLLSVCTVEIGTAEPLTIATTATNVAQGDVVPVATIGAQLVGLTIGPRAMRGIDSQGMLCSAGELGLAPTWFEDGILQFEKDMPLGVDVVERFRLSEDVLDVEVTANRVDCLAVVGLARELAASLGTTIVEPEVHSGDAAGAPFTDVVLESADCKRFVAQRFSKIAIGTSPFWLRLRLALAGQRPIDNIVDISNFVMLETGQPLHFYDFDRLAGKRVVVRDARAGETIRTLAGTAPHGNANAQTATSDGSERTLDGRFLVIADANAPQCIAGLIGSATSAVSETTRELLLEAATFSGPRVRRMSVALGLRTEASSRHEKGLPLGLSTWGAARAAYLLEAGGALVHRPFATGESDRSHPPIAVELARFRALLGIPVTGAEARGALTALGFAGGDAPDTATPGAPNGDAHTLHVRPPFWRNDLRIPEDVIEEVARLIGYDRIVVELPPVFGHSVSSAAYRRESRTAHLLAAWGYREVVTLALQPAAIARTYERAGVALPGPVVEIVNPLSEEQRYLRFSLIPALLELTARFTHDDAYRIFEIGHIFTHSDTGDGASEPFETPGAAWLLALAPLDEPAWHDTGFLTFKGESLAFVRALTGAAAETVSATAAGWHPGKTARLLVDGKDLATIGAVDPRLLAAFDVRARVYAGWMRMSDVPEQRVAQYVAPSKFPAIARDLALILPPEIPAIDVEHAVRNADSSAGPGTQTGTGTVVADVRVFDEYRGPQVEAGKKSLTVHIVLQRNDATLTDAQAETHLATIIAALYERCGATVRT